jgi:hypothetical protein
MERLLREGELTLAPNELHMCLREPDTSELSHAISANVSAHSAIIATAHPVTRTATHVECKGDCERDLDGA